jgi:hypothetical protein
MRHALQLFSSMSNPPMTAAEMGRKGAKNRWSKVSKKERSKQMRDLARLRWDKKKKGTAA